MSKIRKVNICGIPYEVKYAEVIDEAVEGIVSGYIEYNKTVIYIKKGLPEAYEKEVLAHEIIHGIFNHIGKSDLRDNEELVQSLANALCQSFEIKGEK